MLPVDIENIIHDYARQMGVLENLPKLTAIYDLIQKSNRSLVAIGTQYYNIPLPVLMELHLRDEFRLPFLVNFQITAANVQDLDNTLSFCVLRDWATSSVFWLFIQRDPNLYFGAYARMFQDSLLYKLLNAVTSF